MPEAGLAGRHALVIGLAREGIDLARSLPRLGARVAVTDRKPADELGPELAQVQGAPLDLRLGDPAPEAALAGVDVVFASPGVPPENPILTLARARGVPVTSLIELLFALCPAPIVGITGSAGKTTSTTLTGEIFRASGRQTFVGGNIGKPLLGELERMTPESWVVLELSSFQLEPMRVSPHIAAVTNVTPNHLDRHPSMEAYWEAKGQLLAHQSPDDWAILNADDAWSRRYEPRGKVLRFSLEGEADACLRGDALILRGEPLLRVEEVRLPGRHNLANILTAGLVASAAGIERGVIAETARHFGGVAHRLQVVAELDGVRYVDDSIATAPERSIAALKALSDPVVLIAGGKDKHLPMDEWAALMLERCRHVVLLGEMSQLVRDALQRADPGYTAISQAASMQEAVRQARDAAQAGDIVLLSPGGTSYDMYRDFEARGADFLRAVQDLA